MNITELKEKLPDAIMRWADERIEDIARHNAALAIPSVYMKRAVHNVMCMHKDKLDGVLDNAGLFLADEEGNINAKTVADDAVALLSALPESDFSIGAMCGTVGNGKLTVALPDNVVTNILFGSKKTLVFGPDDLLKLRDVIMND